MQTTLKRTPLFEAYNGAKTIDFGGWDLPVQFSSIKEEHEAVRTKVGLFDVSHMGEIDVKGAGALDFLQKVVTNDVSTLVDGKAQYALLCTETAGTVDDLLVYRIAADHYLLCVNASNTDKDYEWLVQHQTEGVEITNVSANYAQLALQGPLAEQTLQTLTTTPLAEMKAFHFAFGEVAGVEALISRSGYTGEDGFELYVAPAVAPKLWADLVAAGAVPCGLGARDTLRFEAVLPLYGQELTAEIGPFEAGVGFAVKLKKEADFIGKAALAAQKENGLTRKIVGIEMIDKGIPRHGYSVFAGETAIGVVTTGTQSPMTKRNIGLALLAIEHTAIDTEVDVEIRGKRLKAKVVPLPFYKREKK